MRAASTATRWSHGAAKWHHVAVKFLNPALVGDVGSMERFLREAEVASKIDSRHVVRILDTGVADGTTSFLVMELLSGVDLAQKLREKKRLGMSATLETRRPGCAGAGSCRRGECRAPGPEAPELVLGRARSRACWTSGAPR